MKINLCMIVKDNSEVKMLSNCLDTVQPYVDNVYITATGKEVDKIEKLCKDRKLNYSYFKWIDDFSAARNFNFSQSINADYILWLDADDLLVGGEYLRKVAEISLKGNIEAVMFNYWYTCSFKGEPTLENFIDIEIDQPRERLLKPNMFNWVGRLHESPIKQGPQAKTTLIRYSEELPIAVMHTASLIDAKNKMQRNLTIVEKQLADEGDNRDPRTLLHLIKIYAELDDVELWNKGLEYCNEYMEKSGWDEERAVCMEYKGQMLQLLGKNDEAIKCFHKAIEEFPFKPIFHLRLSNAYYVAKEYKKCEKWLDIAMQLDISETHATTTNVKGMKVLAAGLMFKLAWYVKKDIDLSLKAIKLLVQEDPSEMNQDTYNSLLDISDMNNACKNLDNYCKYLIDIGEEQLVNKVLYNSPISIQSQPFAIKLIQQTSKPRQWGENEICYFANFGGPHFNKWDGNSIKDGIGGSETAVIRLSEEWTKKGYKVTVFGDPEKPCVINGVTYVPWFYFNRKDNFNIVIQWRGTGLVGKIKTKKMFIDLHDVFNPADFDGKLKKIDKIFVKSKYHRNLAPNIPDNKFIICSNGINL